MNRTQRCRCGIGFGAAMLLVCLASVALAQSDQRTGEPAEGRAVVAPAGPAVMDRGEAARLIVERNIFNRNRGQRPTSRRGGGAPGEPGEDGGESRPVVAAPPPDPGADLVLTGVSLVDDRYLAFFEQTRTGQIQAVAAGETLAGRRIEEMSLDGVKVEQQGVVMMIVVGRTLTGREAGSRASAPSTAERGGRGDRSRSQESDGGERNGAGRERPITSPGASGESDSEVLRRLMERRLQQRQESGR